MRAAERAHVRRGRSPGADVALGAPAGERLEFEMGCRGIGRERIIES